MKDFTLQKHRPKFQKRWNRSFVFDNLRAYKYRHIIVCIVTILSIFWKILLIIERFKTKYVAKRYKASICAIFKDESLGLKEWIEYHKLIGIEHLYLYNNNSTDDSEKIIKPYVDEGYVTLVPWNFAPPQQCAAYQHFSDNFWNETNWVAFIDIDEYICPKQVLDIKDWLRKYEGYPCVTMFWKVFGSNGLIEHNRSKLIIEQYTLAWDKYSGVGKPFFNTRFKAEKSSLKNIHLLPAIFKLGKIHFLIPPINECGKFLKYECNRLSWRQHDFSVQLNHYSTKSYMEFFVTRRKRGDVNSFKMNASIRGYIYTQSFATKADYSIYRFLPFLKIRMNENINNYIDE